MTSTMSTLRHREHVLGPYILAINFVGKAAVWSKFTRCQTCHCHTSSYLYWNATMPWTTLVPMTGVHEKEVYHCVIFSGRCFSRRSTGTCHRFHPQRCPESSAASSLTGSSTNSKWLGNYLRNEKLCFHWWSYEKVSWARVYVYWKE